IQTVSRHELGHVPDLESASAWKIKMAVLIDATRQTARHLRQNISSSPTPGSTSSGQQAITRRTLRWYAVAWTLDNRQTAGQRWVSCSGRLQHRSRLEDAVGGRHDVPARD